METQVAKPGVLPCHQSSSPSPRALPQASPDIHITRNHHLKHPHHFWESLTHPHTTEEITFHFEQLMIWG